MPKKVFWPLVLVVMGLIFLASNLGMLPREFWNLWPVMLIVVGLGGLLTSDRDEWMSDDSSASRKARKSAKTKKAVKSSTKPAARSTKASKSRRKK